MADAFQAYDNIPHPSLNGSTNSTRTPLSPSVTYLSMTSLFDAVFSTSGDGKLAELMAYELLLKYIDERLNPSVKLVEPIAGTASRRPSTSSPLQCTASLTDVVELGYALHASGFFNNGKASIKDIMNLLSDALQLNLRNYSHTFFQIRERKINLTKFIDELKTGLIRYLDQLEQLT